MITAREEGKKRKKEEMEAREGKKKRKKEVWCGDHGVVPWGEAGSSENGKERRKFLMEGNAAKKAVGKQMKQTLLKPLTETEMMLRELVIDMVRQVVEEVAWKVHLENEHDCRNLAEATETFERATRKEKAERMKFAFQLRCGIEIVQLAGYEDGVTNRQAKEKEDAARLNRDTEMRVTELTVRDLKRKAFRKETTEEKADRGRKAKKALIDSLWRAGARKEKEKSDETNKQDQHAEIEYELNKVQLNKKQTKEKPGPVRRGRNPDKVQIAKSKGSALASSRLAKMWADQVKQRPDPIVEARTRGQKRKLFNPVGGKEKAGRMNNKKQDQSAEI